MLEGNLNLSHWANLISTKFGLLLSKKFGLLILQNFLRIYIGIKNTKNKYFLYKYFY